MVTLMDSSRAGLYLPGTVPFRFSEMTAMKDSLVAFFEEHKGLLTPGTRTVSVKAASLRESLGGNKFEVFVRRCPRTFFGLLSLAADEVMGLATDKKVHAQITDWSNCRLISELRPEDSNQILKIRGIVVGVSVVETVVTSGRVRCRKCGKEYDVSVSTKALKCPDCHKSAYVFVRDGDVRIRSGLRQKIKLAQIQQMDMITCVLVGELVDTVKLGDIVDVTGIVEIKTDSKMSRTLAFRVEANYVKVLNGTPGGFASSFIGPSDFDSIQRLSSQKYLFPMLVNSILPNSGLNMVTRALLLLFMFSTIDDPCHILLSRRFDGMDTYTASNPHCILFDETSKFSLFSTRTKHGFRCGAFVAANQGTILVSDLDRFRAAQMTYLEALETCYERIDPFYRVPTTFSSIIVGDPRCIDEAVLDTFSAVIEVVEKQKDVRRATPRPQSYANQSFTRWDDKFLPIAERLLGNGDKITPHDLAKYITYAKQFVKPKWTAQAQARLQEVSQTTQELLKIKNLAQCRARCELRDSVSESDIDDVAELILSANEGFKPRKTASVNSRQKIINDFMTEFKRLSKYKEDGIVTEKEVLDIAEMLSVPSKFVSVDNFLNVLSMNNYILSSGPRKYRPGTAAL